MPHIGEKLVGFCVDRAGMYSRGIFSNDNMPVSILKIMKVAHNIFSPSRRT